VGHPRINSEERLFDKTKLKAKPMREQRPVAVRAVSQKAIISRFRPMDCSLQSTT
jgi:hypothetical protein